MNKDEFNKSKFFVMTRPSNVDSPNLLKIETFESMEKNDDLDHLYSMCFFDYFLNLSNQINKKQHEILISTMIAPISLQFFLTDIDKSNGLIHFFSEQLKQDIGDKQTLETLEKMPDEISKLDFIIRYNLEVFNQDKKNLGLEKALQENKDFFADLEEVFFSLPACFCFGMVDAISLLKPNKKN